MLKVSTQGREYTPSQRTKTRFFGLFNDFFGGPIVRLSLVPESVSVLLRSGSVTRTVEGAELVSR